MMRCYRNRRALLKSLSREVKTRNCSGTHMFCQRRPQCDQWSVMLTRSDSVLNDLGPPSRGGSRAGADCAGLGVCDCRLCVSTDINKVTRATHRS